MKNKIGSLNGDMFVGEGGVSIKASLLRGGTSMALDIINDWISDLHDLREVVYRAEYGRGEPEEPTKEMFKDDPIAFMEARLRYEKNKEVERDGL